MRMLHRADISNFMLQLSAQAAIPSATVPPCWLGPPPREWRSREIVACRDRILHLPSLVQGSEYSIPSTPRFFTPAALGFDFDAGAPRPQAWLNFLNQLWPDDEESWETLQEVMGYFLTADTSQHKIFLFVGPPRSGKGTIARVLTQLIGASNVANPTLSSLVTNFGMSPLIGKTAAIIADARLSGHAHRAAITERLLSISGEDAVTIDRKFQEPITTRLLVRFLVLTNELPALADASGAIASRYVILRFTHSWLGHEGTTLEQRLCSELPGILLWAIEGWRRLNERGTFR